MIFTDIENSEWADEALGPIAPETAWIVAEWTEGTVEDEGIRIPWAGLSALAKWGTYIIRKDGQFGIALEGYLDPEQWRTPIGGDRWQGLSPSQRGKHAEVDWAAARTEIEAELAAIGSKE